MLLPSYCHNCCLYFYFPIWLWIWLNWINAIRSFGYLPRNLMIRFARPLVICWLSLSKCCSIRVERLYLHMSFFCRGSCDRRCCTCSAEVGVLRTCDLSFHHNPYGTEATLHWDFGGIFSGNTNMRKQETTSLCCRYFSRNPDLCTIWPAEGNLKRASARPTHVYLTKAALIIYLITYLICIYHTYKHMHAYIWFTYDII